MSDDKTEPKIGTGHAEAMFRQGLSELRGALYTDSNVAQPSQYGLYGTKTPGEVQQDREADVPAGGVSEVSILEKRLEAMERDNAEREPRDPEMERG